MNIELSVAIASYPYTKYLKDDTVGIDGVNLHFIEIEGPITGAFRRMARTQEFDICEFGISTCFSAIEKNIPITAIPVFLSRQLDHNIMFYNRQSAVREPKDIEGKRVGIRPYTIAGGVWARGVLSEIYGVDLDSVGWVVSDEEHILDCVKPPNVESVPGANLGAMLIRGEIDAGIGVYRGESLEVQPLFRDLVAAEEQWTEKMGFLPIHHTVVLRDAVFNGSPDLAEAVYRAFVRANELYQDQCAEELADAHKSTLNAVVSVQTAPGAHGIASNREALETLVRFADEQHFSPRALGVEELFYPGSSAW